MCQRPEEEGGVFMIKKQSEEAASSSIARPVQHALTYTTTTHNWPHPLFFVYSHVHTRQVVVSACPSVAFLLPDRREIA